MQSKGGIPALAGALGVGALGAAIILAVTLHDVTENGCGSVVHHPGAVFDCGSVVAHRSIATAILALVGVLLLVIARRTWTPMSSVTLLAAALGVCSFGAGVWSLSRGDGNGLDTGICGAVLSKDDPLGLYEAGKPASCRPVHDGRIASARTDFIVAGIAFAAVGAVSVRRPQRRTHDLQAVARQRHALLRLTWIGRGHSLAGGPSR